MAHYDHTYIAPGETRPRRAVTTDPVDRDISGYPHAVPDSDFTTVGDIFSARAQPGSQEGVRHPDAHARPGRPGPRDPGALGRHGRRRDRGRAGRPPRRHPGLPARHRVAAGAPARVPAHRRPRHVHRRHAVPALVQEGGPGDQRGQREPAAGRAGQPVRVRRLAGVDAPAAARVRRRDRPGDRQLRRADRVLRDLALPRRRVRGLLQGAQPEHDRARGRRLVRVRHRRRPGGGRRVRRRRRRAHGQGPAGGRPGSAHRGRDRRRPGRAHHRS